VYGKVPTSRLIVLGCGWSGILVAEKFGSSDVLCIDKDYELGGLLKSVYIDGFTVDVGGTHIIYSRDSGILNELLDLLGGNMVSHERRSYILLDKVFVPYPLENGLYVLPPEERAEALITFIETLLSMEKKNGNQETSRNGYRLLVNGLQVNTSSPTIRRSGKDLYRK